MISNREDFLHYYWKYYCVLEKDFIELLKFVDLRESNYSTTSDIIIKQIQSVCSEFEIVCKEFLDLSMDEKNIKISDIYNGLKVKANEILNGMQIEGLQNVEVCLRRSRNMIIKPFNNWNEKNPGSIFWWKTYNSLKHGRILNYKNGNFKALIYALSALYFMEMILLKKIFQKTQEMDIPDTQSEIFYINNWKVKFSLGSEMEFEKVDEW